MDDKQKQQKPNQLNIELPKEVAKGVYTNLAIISHSHSEFVMDFVQILPGAPKAEVRSRVIMNPENAKRLLLALKENVDKYEQANGPIPIKGGDRPVPPTFGGPTGIA
ncbi:DUF3467 domain-containing protein [Pontibacter sp. G13]|uniref:DUF3467 domain-containing protein n=1 Tax=Pontibacter sp. G13 TaxID=3074898 RepID=UPI00288B5410|nr:DUF3467 domain-containing protein [Pontibacter sp. G13]WNJ17414.1 DUF3467 domain-containing protein [Pontibacter sp. G13]